MMKICVHLRRNRANMRSLVDLSISFTNSVRELYLKFYSTSHLDRVSNFIIFMNFKRKYAQFPMGINTP